MHLPDSSSPSGSWTALMHSQYFARLSQHVFTHPSSPDSAPPPLSHVGVPSSKGQLVQKHPSGLHVISNLLQGGTATALLELIAAAGRTHTALTRMAQLMHGQQQHLLHMGAQQRAVGTQHQGHEQGMAEAVIKPEPGAAKPQLLGSNPIAYRADRVKLEQQEPNQSVAPALRVKAETGRHAMQGSDRELPDDAGRRRRRSWPLAWHVIASSVIHIAKAGLMHAALQVRPPPPWSASDASISSVEVKQELHKATPDVEMQDADAPPQLVQGLHQQQGPQQLPQLPATYGALVRPPPYLTLHMRWQLTHHLAFTASGEITHASQNRASPSAQASQSAPPLQLPNLPGSGATTLPPDAREVAANVPSDARKAAANPAGMVQPAAPTLRCCITSEPELPHAVLQSFRNMAGMHHLSDSSRTHCYYGIGIDNVIFIRSTLVIVVVINMTICDS
jgi:hypothetical protein